MTAPFSSHDLNAVVVPPGADEAAVRRTLLTGYSIEIGAGLRCDPGAGVGAAIAALASPAASPAAASA